MRELKGIWPQLPALGVGITVGLVLVLLVAVVPALTSAPRVGHQPALVLAATPTCSTGTGPLMPGYDPVNHDIYVPNFGLFGASSVSVYNKTCNLVRTIPLASGTWPFQAAFDPANDNVYVTDFGLNEVTIISGTTIVANVTGFDGPEGIVWDPFDLDMDVVNHNDQLVDYIDGQSEGPLFYTGSSPYEIVYDDSCVCDIVTNDGSGNITVNQMSTFIRFSVGVGTDPTGLAYDPVDGYLYVANSGSNNVSVLIDENVAYTVTGFDQPGAIAFDQKTLDVYVTNQGNGKVFVLATYVIVKKESTATGSGADGIAYDAFNDKMYVTGSGNDKLYVLS